MPVTISNFSETLTTYAKPSDQVDLRLCLIVSVIAMAGEDDPKATTSKVMILPSKYLAKVNVMPAEGHKITASYQSC